MSASRDKKIRKEQVAAGTDKRSVAAAKEAQAHRKTVIQYSIVAIVVVAVFVFVFVYNSVWPSRHLTAVTINGEEYTVAELNYYYNASYISFYNNYYYYLIYGYFFDTETSLADQEYSDGYSWRDYFIDAAVESMTEIQLLNDKAEAAGFVMPEEYEEEYAASLESLETSWEEYGYSNLAQYLNMNYGKGVDIDLVSQELYRTMMASAYAEYIYDSFTYTTEELDAYYADNKNEYDIITYAYYYVSADDMDPEEIAAAIDGTSEEEFTAYMEENYEVTPVTLSYDGSSLPTTYSDWLLDETRVPGEATSISLEDDDSGAYVVMFLERENNSYYTTAFRHILIEAVDADEDGEYSEDEIAAAEEEAQAIYEEWLAGDATEESFAELANTYSADTGSNTSGGLYENVTKGYMVEPIDEWLFEDDREVGDTAVVTYSGSNYTGAHVLFFTGYDEELTYAQQLADSDQRNADYSAWLEEAMEDYSVETSHLRMAGKTH